MLKDLKKGGTFLLNCMYTEKEIAEMLPAKVKRDLAKKNISFYIIDAWKIAGEVGLGSRINMVMQAAFFKLSEVMPVEDAIKYLKEGIDKTYKKKGQNIVDMNCRAVDMGVSAIKKINVPESWANAEDPKGRYEELPEFIEEILIPMIFPCLVFIMLFIYIADIAHSLDHPATVLHPIPSPLCFCESVPPTGIPLSQGLKSPQG